MKFMRLAAFIVAATAASAVSAQTPASPTPVPPAPAASAPKMDKKAVSKECSAQADAQKLHGKERKTFRNKCKAMGGKAA